MSSARLARRYISNLIRGECRKPQQFLPTKSRNISAIQKDSTPKDHRARLDTASEEPNINALNGGHEIAGKEGFTMNDFY
jgi:hypothetical protein